MKNRYDSSKGRPHSYAKMLKKLVTVRLDAATVQYFKELAEESEIPYQNLINLYLRDCAANHHRLDLKWRKSKAATAYHANAVDERAIDAFPAASNWQIAR